MARGKGFFAALEVKGSIGDTFTFCTWKGINIVKKKPFPSNPRTTAQTANRDAQKNAVVSWHDQDLVKNDKSAWDLRALMDNKPMSGFNKYVQRHRLAGLTNTWVLLYDLKMDADAAQVAPKVTPDVNCDITLAIIRGPNAGYSEELVAVADVERDFASIDVVKGDVCVFTAATNGDTGESGYFYATVIT